MHICTAPGNLYMLTSCEYINEELYIMTPCIHNFIPRPSQIFNDVKACNIEKLGIGSGNEAAL